MPISPLRHSLLSCGPVLSESMWQVAGLSLQQAFTVSTYCLRQLMTPFQVMDLFQMPLFMDSTVMHLEELNAMNWFVFRLTSLRNDLNLPKCQECQIKNN